MSFDRSRIRLRVPRGLSGGRLVALVGVALAVRLDVEDLTSLATEGLDPWRFDLLPDLPLDSLSKTLELPAEFTVLELELLVGLCCVFSFVEADLDNLSIREFLRVTGFFRSLSE